MCGTDVHSGTAGWPACRIRSFPGTCRRARSSAVRGSADRHRRQHAARRRPRGVLRRPSHLRPLPRLHRAPDADAVRRAPRLRHHRPGGRRAVRRLGAGDLSRARRRRGAAAGRRVVRRLHRRRLRPADGGPHPRAGGAASRRQRARAGRRRRRPERDRARAARRSGDGLRHRRARGRLDLARRMGADHVYRSRSHDRRGAAGAICARRTHGEGVDVVIEAAGSPRAFEEGLTLVRDGGRYVDRRPLHRRRAGRDQRASADQPQAPRDSRLLGQRARAFPAGAGDARAARGRGAVAATSAAAPIR